MERASIFFKYANNDFCNGVSAYSKASSEKEINESIEAFESAAYNYKQAKSFGLDCQYDINKTAEMIKLCNSKRELLKNTEK